MIGPNNSLVQMIFFLYFSSDVEIKFRKFEIWECRRCAVITQSPLGILYIILPNRIKTTTIVITGQQKMKNDICFVISSVSLSSHVETITRWAQTQRRRHVFSNRVLSIVLRDLGQAWNARSRKSYYYHYWLSTSLQHKIIQSMNVPNHSSINLQ